MADVLILPAIYMGLVLGLYEFFAIHKDLAFRGSHFLKHFWHSLLVTMLFIFVLMNMNFVFESIPALSTIPFLGNEIVVRVIIGLITILKVHGSGVVARGAGRMGSIGETWVHALIITALIQAAPFAWPFVSRLISQYLPFLPV
ncbi:hypothetical protein J4449_00560 [Candidatus Woesearchaeota archaeon]|nr:hypothetical protein [Candidatus Woesearchaeota archaeon]